ncbi:MAG TPA: choice-of-anchor Q domain-containing protein [Casimicrobiaceae bacterium]|nr:choice-of-anchor Q domain-containing protein [Casimicrobiaceae bacterium]
MNRLTSHSGVKFLACTLLALFFFLSAACEASSQDITSQFSIARSGFVLNRSTGTFDQTVTLKNIGSVSVPAPISAVFTGLPATVTLANKTGMTSDGKPYVSPIPAGSVLQSGATLSVVLRFNNPQRVAVTYTLQVLYLVPAPAPGAPTLISVVATGGTNAYLVGRADGAENRNITLQASAAPTCFLGSLVGGAPVGGGVATTTDALGYFGVSVSGVNPGAFLAAQLTAPNASPMSACLVSSRDNDSWPKAFALDGSPVNAQDFIDAPGKARWYRFNITPGQSIQVALTHLPGDYDLAVFKDIAQTFANQFAPGSGTTVDLLKLTAEYAPTIFSPTIFSPTIFSPDAYSPTIFSPTIFSPTIFSPTIFSPTIFSPTIFSPTIFSPTIFSPTIFSPTIFSPTIFSPTIFSAMEIAQAFSTAQTRSVIAVSPTPGTGDKSLVVNTWNSTGNFYVRVTGRGGAFNTSTPFMLTVTKGPTTCAGVTDTTLTPRAAVMATGLSTLILTDSSAVALDATLPGPEGVTLRSKLAAFAQRGEVKGVVVDVAGDQRVKVLKQQAANNPACPFAVNLVAQEIKGIVDSYRSNPLQYVVIAGNDAAIPFFRFPDESGLGPESAYVPPVQSNSDSEASLRRNFVLSQDPYGSKTSISFASNDFPVPGLPVGRLVETAPEIASLIDAYIAANGVVVPQSSLATGYDFLASAANAVNTELQLGMGAGGLPDTLITPDGVSPQDPQSWSATALANKLFGSHHDVIFLAGHFSANSALAADFSTNLVTTDLAASTTDFVNSIVFSAGCHSGYNLVDSDAIPGVTLPLDWAQAFARKSATLIAGTGYQYGDTDFIKYSAQIYLNLAREFRAGNGPIPIGAALVAAKLDYLATTPDIRGISEKSLLEATLFGLPMLAINMPSGRGSGPGGGTIAPVAVASGPAQTLGLETYDLSVAPVLTPQAKNLTNVAGGANVTASWLSGPDGVVSNPGEPVLPLAALNVTPNDPSLVLRGIGFRGGTYVDSAPLVPFSGAPTTELRGVHVPFVSPVFYPALGRVSTPNYFGALAGTGGTELLVTPAQHIAADMVAGTSTRRQYTGLGLRLFFSGNLSQAALSDAPSIVSVDAEPNAGGALFAAQVTGDPAAAIHQVWVTYTGDGANAWTSLDLSQCVAPLPAACGGVADSRQWAAQLTVAPANLKYIVQAVSGVGLVALDDNRGAYYQLGGTTPAATADALVSPPTNATVGDTVSVSTKLTFAGVPVAGKTVIVTIGGITQVGTTAADGSVTVNLPLGIPPGSYVMTVSFAGDATFQPSSTTTTFAVAKAPSSLAALAPAGATLTGLLGGATVAVQQEAVSFSVTGPAGSTTIFANTDELGQAKLPPPSGLPAGTYTVTHASFGGDATFNATAIALSQQFMVPKLAQSITFDPLANKNFGDPDFAVFAAASSGLAVTFGASGACTIAGNTVHLTGAGSCTITADQPGDANTNPAPQVARMFSIVAAPTIVSLVRAQPSPTMADSVTYTLTFSEAVTGVTAGNFGLATGGVTAASVASIGGSGTTWTVTVNTGRGSGTLRLDLANGTGIVDASNVPLAGTPFTGETYGIDKGGTVLYGASGTDGQPVASFGSGGYALFGDVPIAAALGLTAVLPDGRILVASAIGCDPQTSLCTLQLGRYLATGALDASFGTNGRVVTSVNNVYPELSGISVNADGTFLVGGIRNNGTSDVPFVAKVTSTGAADVSFGTGGVAVLDSLPLFVAISGFAVDASGRGVIAGSTVPIPNQVHTFVARLTNAGALDASFGSGGVATFSISPVNDQGRSVAIQPDGKIVVGGRTRPTPGVFSSDLFLVLRIDASGALDPTFGTNGVATTRIAGTPGANIGRRLVLQPDGKIVLVGNLLNLDGTAFAGCGIARFNGDGTLDAGFGNGGQVFEPRLDQGCLGVSLQPDGKTVIVGDASDADVSIAGFVRLLLDGSPDPTFGNNGGVGISSYGSPAPVAVTASGNLLTTLAIQDPADGVIKSYVAELQSTLAGPWLAQSITFNSLPDMSYGALAFSVSASTSSQLPVSFTSSGPCTVAGNMVQVGGVGTCTITASQAGNATYFAAAPQPQTFTIASATQSITFGPAPSGVTVGQPLVFFTATSSSPTGPPSAIPIMFTSLTPAICATSAGLNGELLTLLTAGQCTIAANQSGDANYNAAPQATQTFTVGPAGVPPSVFTVTNLNDRGAGSLRSAIASANATAPGPNLVNFAPGLTGTIVLTTGQIQISRSVLIQGPGADNLTIDGNANSRIFSIFATDPACPALDGPDYVVLISGLRLTNAWRTTSNGAGAIFTEHSLALDSVIVENSVARQGAGLYFQIQYPGQTLTITNSQFLNNVATPDVFPAGTAAQNGAGMRIAERCTTPQTTPVTVIISNSLFSGNLAQPTGTLTANGGAFDSYSLADIAIADSRIVANQVVAANPPVPGFGGTNYRAAGIHATAKSLLIYRTEIADNAVTDPTGSDTTRAGGLNLYQDDPTRQGPADAMAVRIVDSTISGNTVAATGGAMTVYGDVALELDNTTVANNSAAPTRTGGIIMSTGATEPSSAGNATPPSLKLVSSLLADNDTDVANNRTTISAFGINVFDSLIQNPCSICVIVISGPGSLVGVDPLLAPLAFNGGTKRTHALLPGSPAIDTGNNAVGLNTDQRGHGFPRVSGSTADIGAYEASQAVPLATGTYFDRVAGLIGTSFLFDPVTVTGTLPSITVTGPPSWNGGNTFSCVRYQPQGRQPVVDGAPFAYFTTATGNLVVVDTAANEVDTTVAVGANPYAAVVNPGGTRVYVSNFNDNTVSVLDASTNGVIATVPVGAGPQGLAVNPSGTRVYVASFTAGTVSVIDGGTNAVITAIPVAAAVDVVVNQAGTRLYVADGAGVAIVDTATNLVTGSIPKGALSSFATIAISKDDTRLYAWSSGTASVAVIDISTSSIVATIPIASAFANDGIAVDPSGAPVYQSNGGSVAEIDPATNSVVHTVPLGTVGSGVNGVAVTPDGEQVYTATASGVRTFDTATETVTPIATGAVRALGHFIGSGPTKAFEDVQDRSICWTLALPITGNYSAQGIAGGTPFTGTSSLDATSQLAAPQITSLTTGADSVTVGWTAPPDAGSFLVRVNAVPFTGIIDEEIVSGASRAATFTGLGLISGANYQVTVFAFSDDLLTPDSLSGVFNISTHSENFVGP